MYRVSALLPRHLESLLSFLGSELPWDAPGRPVWGAGGGWGLTLLASPPARGECRLITQLAAPGRPPPIPHHLQPGSARNTLGLLPSTHGLQPRVLPRLPWPCPGPFGGTKVGAGGASRKKKAPTHPLGAEAGAETAGRGVPSCELRSQSPPSSLSLPCSHLCMAPRGVGSLPAPLSCLLVSPNRAFRDGGWGGEGTRSQGRGGRRGRRQFNFQSWSCQFRSWRDKKVISVIGF